MVTKLDKGYTGPGLLNIKTITSVFATAYSDDQCLYFYFLLYRHCISPRTFEIVVKKYKVTGIWVSLRYWIFVHKSDLSIQAFKQLMTKDP